MMCVSFADYHGKSSPSFRNDKHSNTRSRELHRKPRQSVWDTLRNNYYSNTRRRELHRKPRESVWDTLKGEAKKKKKKKY